MWISFILDFKLVAFLCLFRLTYLAIHTFSVLDCLITWPLFVGLSIAEPIQRLNLCLRLKKSTLSRMYHVHCAPFLGGVYLNDLRTRNLF